jgi:hypothetical protein
VSQVDLKTKGPGFRGTALQDFANRSIAVKSSKKSYLCFKRPRTPALIENKKALDFEELLYKIERTEIERLSD